MTYHSVDCPRCGIKINLRASSFGTLRKCPSCGQKIVVNEPPIPWLTILFALFVMFIGVPLLCCGGCIMVGSFVPDPEAAAPDAPVIGSESMKTPQKPRHELEAVTNESSGTTTALPADAVTDDAPQVTEETPDQPASESNETPADAKPRHEPRLWSSKSGTFKTEATFVRYSNGKVHLLRADNDEEIVVEVEKLSQEDRDYIEHLQKNLLGRPR